MTLKEMNDKVFKLIGSPAERNEKIQGLKIGGTNNKGTPTGRKCTINYQRWSKDSVKNH